MTFISKNENTEFFIFIEFLRNCSTCNMSLHKQLLSPFVFFFLIGIQKKTLNTIPRLDMFMTNRIQKKPL